MLIPQTEVVCQQPVLGHRSAIGFRNRPHGVIAILPSEGEAIWWGGANRALGTLENRPSPPVCHGPPTATIAMTARRTWFSIPIFGVSNQLAFGLWHQVYFVQTLPRCNPETRDLIPRRADESHLKCDQGGCWWLGRSFQFSHPEILSKAQECLQVAN